MRFLKFFLNRRVSSASVQAETHSSQPSDPRPVATAGENHESSSSTLNAASAGGMQAALVDSSTGTNQALTVPQSIIPGAPSGEVSSDESSPALKDTDKFLSALQVLSGMVLPLALPQVAKTTSQLLSLISDKRRNDAGVRDLLMDISKIIFSLVPHSEESNSTERERIVADIKSCLKELRDFCEEYQKGNSLNRFFFSSDWKAKIDEFRGKIQTQLNVVSNKAILAVLDELNSLKQRIETAPSDQAFQNMEFSGNVNVKITNYSQSGLDQSLPIPPNQGSSSAFKGTKFGGGDITIRNHHQEFAQRPTW